MEKEIEMGRVIVKNKRNQYKLYCNTMDAFISPALKEVEMRHYIANDECWSQCLGPHMDEIIALADKGSEYYDWTYCTRQTNRTGWKEDLKPEMLRIKAFYKELKLK